MGSLETSGWNKQDKIDEISDIYDYIKNISYASMMKMDRDIVDNALNVASFIYLGENENIERKKEAFEVSERAEYVKSQGCGFALLRIKNAININQEIFETDVSEIQNYFIDKFDKFGFTHLIPELVFNTKSGHFLHSSELHFDCFYNNSKEAAEFFVFANHFYLFAFDYLDVVDSRHLMDFDSVEDYFDFLSTTHYQKNLNDLMKQNIISLSFRHPIEIK